MLIAATSVLIFSVSFFVPKTKDASTFVRFVAVFIFIASLICVLEADDTVRKLEWQRGKLLSQRETDPVVTMADYIQWSREVSDQNAECDAAAAITWRWVYDLKAAWRDYDQYQIELDIPF